MNHAAEFNVVGLLDWFRQAGIVFPWAARPNPYRVWISEIMLQQTVVTTVIRYFNEWMERFPTVKVLAQATESEILRRWEGLGYYSRARNIHKTANIIIDELCGKIPCDYTELCRLPGIGAYTAGAIMSIAYNKPYTVMDANILRIMQRLLALQTLDTEGKRKIEQILGSIIPQDEPGLFNQALMQLGQLVCRKQLPLCENCPLSKHCLALERDIQDTIPAKKNVQVVFKESSLIVFCYKKECYVITVEHGLFRGLTLFPRWEVIPKRSKANLRLHCLRRETR